MPKKARIQEAPAPVRETLGLSPAVLAKRTTYKAEPWGPNLDPLMVHYDPWSDPYNPRTINCRNVVRAYRVIHKIIPNTPLVKANGPADIKMNLYFKRETVHKTGCFHERSAIYALHKLTKEQRENGIFTASLGNWGMALSYHAQKMNIPVTVFVPTNCQANFTLRSNNLYGASTVIAGKSMTEARKLAIEKMKENTGAADCYISGYDHPHVIAGAGTIGIEILEQLPNVDAILVPIGGGGLIAGIAAVVKKLKPDTLIYGIEKYRSCCFYKSLIKGKPYTILDAQLASMPSTGYNAFQTGRSLIDKVLLVDDDSTARAVLYFVEEERLIVERRGAMALAVLLAEPNVAPELREKNVVCLVTGGSIDLVMIPRAFERAKVAEGRMITIRLALPIGRTDLCSKAFKLISHMRCSIVHHDMEHVCLENEDMGKYYVIMTCETKGPAHAATVRRVLQKLYPGRVRFSEESYFEHITCPCYPKMWPDL